jgi:DNA-binding CsgD family transcriptional regulator
MSDDEADRATGTSSALSPAQFAQVVGAQPTFPAFVDRALLELAQVLDAELVTFNRLNMTTLRATIISRPFRDEYVDAVESVSERLLEHPMLAWVRQQPTWPVARLSDVASVDELARSALYREVLVPIGAAFSLFMFMSSPRGHHWVYFVANRPDRDFSAAAVRYAEAVQPALIAALARWSFPQADSDESPSLTRREMDVLSHLAAGMTADAMAHALGASPATVRKHLQNTYAKLQVQDRLGAVLRARALGLLNEEDLSSDLVQQIQTEMKASARENAESDGC